MRVKGIVNFWRRKTLARRLEETSEEDLVELRWEVNQKIDEWYAVSRAIQLEFQRRHERQKGA